MEIFTKEIAGSSLGIRGEVDADNCASMVEQVLAAEVSGDDLVLDLSELTFLDSSGISALLSLKSTVEERQHSFQLRNPTDSVRRVLEITGLTDVFGLD